MHGFSAIDVDGLAGDEVAGRGGQKHDGAHQILGKLIAVDGPAGGAGSGVVV